MYLVYRMHFVEITDHNDQDIDDDQGSFDQFGVRDLKPQIDQQKDSQKYQGIYCWVHAEGLGKFTPKK